MSEKEPEEGQTKYDFPTIRKDLGILLQEVEVPYIWKVELMDVIERFASRSRLDEIVRVLMETENLELELSRDYVQTRGREINDRMVHPNLPKIESYVTLEEARSISINARSDELKLLEEFVEENDEYVDARAIRRHIIARRAINVAMATRPSEGGEL